MTTPQGRNGPAVPADDAGLSSPIPLSLMLALDQASAHARSLEPLPALLCGDGLPWLRAEMRFAQEIPRLIAAVVADRSGPHGLFWCRLLAKIHAYGMESLLDRLAGDGHQALQRAAAQAWDVANALDAAADDLRSGGAV
ncbi:hypothetical protein [Thiomonas sp.]|uniref:hypothetical protein n=1 Tax=Thiomonas sp. TaxID=2047785 RepID=UPI00176AF632|nr:hypothetical protein [Thiomonas sp.]